MPLSTFTGLSTISSGLTTHQLALNTVGHNITNADTEGYSRQQVSVATRISQTVYTSTGVSQVGNGGDVISICRARDLFADRQYWRENCTLGYYQVKAQNYDEIEAILDDSEDLGIQNAMNKFISALENLDSTASNDSVRANVRDSGKNLVKMMDDSVSQLRNLINEDVNDLELYVGKVNELTGQIADLNKQIVKTEGRGGIANDLRDSRDLLVDELGSYINISISERENGAYAITSNGSTLVYEHVSVKLQTERMVNSVYGADDLRITIEGTNITYSPTNGKLKGYQDGIEECKNYMDKLSQMAAYLLTEFNTLHNSGYGLNDCATGVVLDANGDPMYRLDANGQPIKDKNGNDVYMLNYSNNFFGNDEYRYTYNTDGTVTKEQIDAQGNVIKGTEDTLTIAEILAEFKVNSKFDEEGGTNLIAAKRLPETLQNGTKKGEDSAAGTNAALLADSIKSSRTGTILDANGKEVNNLFGGNSMSEFYITTITELGISAQETDNYQSDQEGILEEIVNWRSDTSGVNWDEELSKMIMYSKGYKACSQCLTTINDMLDTLIACV